MNPPPLLLLDKLQDKLPAVVNPPIIEDPAAGIASHDGDLNIPLDLSEGVSLAVAPSVELTITVEPKSGDVLSSQVTDGKVITELDESLTVVAEPTAEGFRLISVAETREAAERVEYDLDLPSDYELKLDADGGVQVWDVTETNEYSLKTLVAEVEPPWAMDADGEPLPTQFELDGNTLVQVVEVPEGATFPIVADPSVRAVSCGQVWVKSSLVWRSGRVGALLEYRNCGGHLKNAYNYLWIVSHGWPGQAFISGSQRPIPANSRGGTYAWAPCDNVGAYFAHGEANFTNMTGISQRFPSYAGISGRCR